MSLFNVVMYPLTWWALYALLLAIGIHVMYPKK